MIEGTWEPPPSYSLEFDDNDNGNNSIADTLTSKVGVSQDVLPKTKAPHWRQIVPYLAATPEVVHNVPMLASKVNSITLL